MLKTAGNDWNKVKNARFGKGKFKDGKPINCNVIGEEVATQNKFEALINEEENQVKDSVVSSQDKVTLILATKVTFDEGKEQDMSKNACEEVEDLTYDINDAGSGNMEILRSMSNKEIRVEVKETSPVTSDENHAIIIIPFL
ncbi:hypothetical protein K7X08_025755 [Anisodus acutangulus]|uniref:Uncharacterized protein n=1 Tax=Anisodus acutangulus TaxID=402998 RepID=A0A9Q1QX14_9SOLA|nr:hypothetical protein K7X08_025755 [Anisodus acutangulus]